MWSILGPPVSVTEGFAAAFFFLQAPVLGNQSKWGLVMDVEVLACPQGVFNHPGAAQASSSWGQDGPGTHFCQLRLPD